MLAYQIGKYVVVISTFYIYWNMELLEDVIYSIMIFVLHEIARSVREYSRKQARHTVYAAEFYQQVDDLAAHQITCLRQPFCILLLLPESSRHLYFAATVIAA